MRDGIRGRDNPRLSEKAVAERLRVAVAHHQAGRLADAEVLYREIICAAPNHSDALNLLGLIAARSGRKEAAVDLIGKAVRANPTVAMYQLNFATALKDLGDLAGAAENYRRAIRLDPRNPNAHYFLGNILESQGRLVEAIESHRRAIRIKPDFPEAYCNLALALNKNGERNEAIECYKKALAVRPVYPEAHFNLGRLFHDQGCLEEAEENYQLALAANPELGQAHINLGVVLKLRGRTREAAEHYEKALALCPGSPEVLVNYAIDLNDLGRHDLAEAALRRALEIRPEMAEAYCNLGNCLKSQGQLAEAISGLRTALRIKPDYLAAFSGLLLVLQYAEGWNAISIRAEHDLFADRFEKPLRQEWRPHRNLALAERRLKLGYVSADFRTHSAAYFLEPLLASHDKEMFELYCYYNHSTMDGLTERFIALADHWVPCVAMSDDALAQRIRADGIDILVDVSGHTEGHRLLTFARKPAPVQVTWLGYPCTTGLKAIDYRITDRHAEPEGMTEHLNVETLWRMPDFFCCYRAHEDSPVPIDHPPADDNGHVTFGCFNNFAKVTDAVLTLWSEILKRSPDARLLLEIVGIDNPKFLGETQDRLSRLGLPLERVELLPRKASNQYVLYNRIDIALDPFPCNGGTTSLDTLWMGVPFVTLEGRHFVSRMGVSILTNAGLPELIAKSEEEYVDLAVRLATDRGWLRRIRDGLRERVEASPLMDARGFAANLEVAYRAMWRTWCEGQIGLR